MDCTGESVHQKLSTGTAKSYVIAHTELNIHTHTQTQRSSLSFCAFCEYSKPSKILLSCFPWPLSIKERKGDSGDKGNKLTQRILVKGRLVTQADSRSSSMHVNVHQTSPSCHMWLTSKSHSCTQGTPSFHNLSPRIQLSCRIYYIPTCKEVSFACWASTVTTASTKRLHLSVLGYCCFYFRTFNVPVRHEQG